MNLKEFNNLTDLFFHQSEKQKQKDIFLEWLNKVSRKKFIQLKGALASFFYVKCMQNIKEANNGK